MLTTGLFGNFSKVCLGVLKIALNIVIYNRSLNSFDENTMLVEGTLIRITFHHNGTYYQLESIIGRSHSDNPERRWHFYYKQETLKTRKAKAKIRSREELTDFSDDSTIKVELRSELPENLTSYLDDDKSFINPIIKGNGSYVQDNLIFNYINVPIQYGATPAQILEVFDDSIETLSLIPSPSGDNSAQWNLKFKGIDAVYRNNNPIALNLLVNHQRTRLNQNSD